MSGNSKGTPACACEPQIVDLVLSGTRADGDARLLAHAAQCPACAETIELARLLAADRACLCRDARVPSPGAVWWRATIRARAEAARTAAAPMTLLQGIAGATAAGVFVAFGGGWWRAGFSSWLERAADVASLVGAGRAHLESSASVASLALPMFLTVAACLVVAPVAIYLATVDES